MLGVRATGINHVSIHADDIEASVRFYEDLFGAERLPTPNFGMAVQWLQLGRQQLHIFMADTGPPRYHHLAFDVDDFDAVYRAAKARGALDAETYGSALREHPSGWVQMYLRDPAGNLLEIDWPDAASLAPDTRAAVDGLEQLGYRQDEDQRQATLYQEETREPLQTTS
jgi:catechol 2,3-dioxygenase-like lactoylglutathione lyase family enzyme